MGIFVADRFQVLFFLAIILCFQTSCAAAEGGSRLELADLRLNELYFPEGEYVSLLPQAQQPTTFCMKSIVESDAQLVGVSQVTGFAEALKGAAGRPCDIEVSYFLDGFEVMVAHGRCEWGLDLTSQPRLSSMNITSLEAADIEECFLRLAMANAGYPGALTLDFDALFMPREKTLWMGYNGFPANVPRAPHQFFACGGITPPHLTDDFVIPDSIPC